MKKISFKNILTLMTLVALTAFYASCSDNDITTDDKWDISGNQIVNIKPERYKMLRNPMQGWVLYSGIGDGLSDKYWEQYDSLESTVGKVKVSDYATVLYIRGAWSDFNPEEGVYIWQPTCNTAPAKRFRMLTEGAKARGLKLAFTFVVDSRDKHYDFTPAYVKNAGANGYTTTTGSVQVWSPYPDDSTFQKYYAKFLTDFAAKYNDPDTTMFISGFGLGKWGETHTLLYSTGDETPRMAVYNWISDLMIKLFTKVPVVINYHRCILNGKSFNSNVVDTMSVSILNSAVAKGFSLRQDAFGMKSYYTTWERSFANKYKYIRPIIEEGGWVKASHGNSIKGDGYSNYAEVRKGEFDEGKASYVNMMDFRYSSTINSGETWSWFNEAYKLVQEFIQEGGYRLYPDKISVPTNVSNGSRISITHRWSNLGWGYCPTNIPQWNQKYKVAFALLNKNTEKVLYTFVDETPKLNEWIKGTPMTYNYQFNLSGVENGDYTWAVGLVDTSENNKIGIQISAKDDQLTSEGWLKLCDVNIH